MSKTIEQLRDLATKIEEATRQGENTQLRVGGLFNDIIDFIAQIPITETTLGPLLQALNNSGLINPNDGQTLTFSIMDDNWTFSDGLTQLQLRLGEISMTVTSNYEDWLRAKEQIDHYLALINERTRSLESDNIEYHSWRDQTDDHIADMVVAQDRMSGEIVSISSDVMTAWEQIRTTTNNLEISDKALKRICEICDVSYTNPDGTYSASWLYQNKQQIMMAAANFDADGNIIQGSVIDVSLDGITAEVRNVDGRVTTVSQTVDGVRSEVRTVDGRVTTLSQTIDGIQLAVAADQSQIDTINGLINGTTGNPGILSRLTGAENKISGYASSASWIDVNKDKITAVTANFDAQGKPLSSSGLVTTGNFSGLFSEAYDETGATTAIAEISTSLVKKVDSNGVQYLISQATIAADHINMSSRIFTGWFDTFLLSSDKIIFKFKSAWSVCNENGTEVMWLTPDGDLHIGGSFYYDRYQQVVVWGGSHNNKMYITDNVSNGACLIGKRGNNTVIDLGFSETAGGTENYGVLKLGYGSDMAELHSHFLSVSTSYAKSTLWTNDLEFTGGGTFRFGSRNRSDDSRNFILISASSRAHWPTVSEVFAGEVYLDGDTLKVKG